MARTKCRAGKAGRCRKQNCLKHGPWGLNTFVVNKALTNERGIWIEVTEDIQAELNPNQTVMRRVQQQWMCKREKLKFADKKQDLDTIDCSATEQLRGKLGLASREHPAKDVRRHAFTECREARSSS